MQREVAIILKVKNAAEVRKELKDVFNRGTTAAVGSYNKAITKTDKKQLRVARSAKKAGRGVKGFGNILMGSVASLYAYTRAFRGVVNLMDKGGSFERAGEAFKRNVGSIETSLPALRNATRGVVTDLSLMKTATRAVIEGLPKGQIANAFKIAAVAAHELGGSTEDAMKNVVRAFTRHDEAAMKSLGIITKTNSSFNIQMGILSKSGKLAAPGMRIQARANMIMKQMAPNLKRFNDLRRDGLELLRMTTASWGNLKNVLGTVILKAFRPLLEMLPKVMFKFESFLNMVKSNKSLEKFTNHLFSFGAALGSIAAAMSGLKLFKLMGVFFGFNSIIKLGIATLVGYAFGIKDIGQALGTAFTMGKVFFALLQSYNSDSGLSKIAKKDADSLDDLYGVVLQAARFFKMLQAAGEGAMNGILQGLTMLSPLMGSLGSFLTDIFQSLKNGDPVAESTLRRIRNGFAAVFNVVTKVAIPILAIVGAMKTLGFVTTAALFAFNFTSAIVGMGLFTAKIILATAKMVALGTASAVAWAAANPIAALGIAAVGGAGYVTHQAMTSENKLNTSPVSQQGMSGSPTMAPQNTLLTSEDEKSSKVIKLLQKIYDISEKGDNREERKNNEYQGNSFNSGAGIFEGI